MRPLNPTSKIFSILDFTWAERAHFVHKYAMISLQKYIGQTLETEVQSPFFNSGPVKIKERQRLKLQNDVNRATQGLQCLGVVLQVSKDLSKGQGIDIVASVPFKKDTYLNNYVFTAQVLTEKEETFPVEDHSTDEDHPPYMVCEICGTPSAVGCNCKLPF